VGFGIGLAITGTAALLALGAAAHLPGRPTLQPKAA
jgi:hypothetical protein